MLFPSIGFLVMYIGISMILHGTPGSYLRDALHEGKVDALTCLLAPEAKTHTLTLSLDWRISTAFLVIKNLNKIDIYVCTINHLASF
jgi:hypothetical protein